jgi:SagB-type dehydrogenase family enzyme
MIHSCLGAEDLSWELFHENSKTSRFLPMGSDEVILNHMASLWESLPYDQYPVCELPPASSVSMPIQEAIHARQTARCLSPTPLTLDSVATLFHSAYGLTRDLREQGFPRPFRTVPSGGALYPLELYFYSAYVESLPVGIYHYNASEHHLRFLLPGEHSGAIAGGLVQENLATDAALIVFITAIFERSIFKYGDRGYRFTLLEAGHVAQNFNLIATALGYGCVNIGGYFDRQIDDLLGLDGLTHSTIYMTAIGANAAAT